MFDSRTHVPHRGHPLQDLAHALRALLETRQDRRALQQLKSLSADGLRDLGLTHSDVRRALSLPLSQDAATELRRASLMRARTGM